MKGIAVKNANHIQVIDRDREIGAKRSDDAIHGRKPLVVTLGHFLALAIPASEVAKFDGKETGLQRIEATVVAFDLVIILLRLAVVAKHAHGPGHAFVVGGYPPSFSTRSAACPWVEA